LVASAARAPRRRRARTECWMMSPSGCGPKPPSPRHAQHRDAVLTDHGPGLVLSTGLDLDPSDDCMHGVPPRRARLLVRPSLRVCSTGSRRAARPGALTFLLGKWNATFQ
jgi:hypothetical protein